MAGGNERVERPGTALEEVLYEAERTERRGARTTQLSCPDPGTRPP
ncbi:hypothetical protein [Streptomyces malaysiense]|nr:hypothetical protein [Streptomyces malaysiense]